MARDVRGRAPQANGEQLSSCLQCSQQGPGPSELGLGNSPHCSHREPAQAAHGFIFSFPWVMALSPRCHLSAFSQQGYGQVPASAKCSALQAGKKVALGALRESKTKTLNPLHQQKLALKSCKPGPNCMERMIAFEALSSFLSIKHLSLKGYCLISGCRKSSGSN